ncbi:MAG TPA: fumarylacetoacetate hydrolase family protein [Gemmatimonadales bacterium]|jgi:2-keto-4-pentenoate hydratase/2-oxohepta-3-ene-1,7-dioic acid hydratase in catechol pathway|nr:fumarylacetoacetate hydrolase family protein [Gemmatimonadales bacterium]
MRTAAVVVLTALTAALPLTAQSVSRYVRYSQGSRTSYGLLEGTTIRELSGDPFSTPRPTGRTARLADVRLLAPIDPARGGKVLGVAINTRRPGREESVPHPRWFAKMPTSLVGPEADVDHPPEASNLDWEGELVLVIGRRARHVTVEEAPRYIFGVSVGNDFSENTWYGERQGVNEPSRLISKSVDTWAALGPAIVTGVDYTDLRVDIRVNGETVATGRTSQLLNNPAQLVSYLSRYITLLPGDLIYTGTYPTIGGKDNTVHPGDVVEVEIEQLGMLRSRIVPMQSPLPPPPVARNRGEAGPQPPAPSPGGGAGGGAPQYQVDPFWPRELPNNWIIGQVSGVAVGPNDHIWIVHRPRTLTAREAGAVQNPPLSTCCVPAPSVLELDQDGNVVRAWGGPAAPGGASGENRASFWPGTEHGITVDAAGNVWIGSNGRADNVVLKFSAEGRFLLQIGRAGETGGSNDTVRLGQPTAVDVDVPANEVYVADGYRNRRVIVFNATTGAYKRHWGAYGRRPIDGDSVPYDAAVASMWPPSYDTTKAPQQFHTVHGVRLSSDGLVYVADRVNNRIQVFRKDGAFVREVFLARATRAMGSVWDIAFSRDSAQSYVFVPDGTNQKIWILRRSDLSVVASFGRGGRQAGQFGWVHNLAVDSRGNLYTGEVDIYKRVQRFSPRAAGPGSADPRRP